MSALPSPPLLLDVDELACIAQDGGVRLDELLGLDALVAERGSAEHGRASLRRRGLLDDSGPAAPEGALATLVWVAAEPDRLFAVHERRPPVPRARVGLTRGDVALVLGPVPAALWQPPPRPPGPVAAPQEPGGRAEAVVAIAVAGEGADGADQVEEGRRPSRVRVGVTPVDVEGLVDEVVRGTALDRDGGPPPSGGVDLPVELWKQAAIAARVDRTDAALLQLRAAGVEPGTASNLVEAATQIGGGGGVVVQRRRADRLVQDDVGWFQPADEEGPWILVDVVDADGVRATVTTAAGVAGRVRALVEEIR